MDPAVPTQREVTAARGPLHAQYASVPVSVHVPPKKTQSVQPSVALPSQVARTPRSVHRLPDGPQVVVHLAVPAFSEQVTLPSPAAGHSFSTTAPPLQLWILMKWVAGHAFRLALGETDGRTWFGLLGRSAEAVVLAGGKVPAACLSLEQATDGGLNLATSANRKDFIGVTPSLDGQGSATAAGGTVAGGDLAPLAGFSAGTAVIGGSVAGLELRANTVVIRVDPRRTRLGAVGLAGAVETTLQAVLGAVVVDVVLAAALLKASADALTELGRVRRASLGAERFTGITEAAQIAVFTAVVVDVDLAIALLQLGPRAPATRSDVRGTRLGAVGLAGAV
jgi:hypothetical protein